MALRVIHRDYLIQTGELVLHDSAREMIRRDLVRTSYLGERG
jgi:ABC-type lipopolysaccharide export system ATPase subunit